MDDYDIINDGQHDYPEPPPYSLKREGDTGYLCPTCGSSLYREWRFIFLMRTPYCIQPECKNYYGTVGYKSKCVRNRKEW